MHRQGRKLRGVSQLIHGYTAKKQKGKEGTGVTFTLFCVDPGQCLPILGAEAKTPVPSGEERKRGKVLAPGSAHLNLNCFRQW